MVDLWRIVIFAELLKNAMMKHALAAGLGPEVFFREPQDPMPNDGPVLKSAFGDFLGNVANGAFVPHKNSMGGKRQLSN